MATDKREVELIIKANNLSSKTLKEVTTAVDSLSSSIDKQVAAAKKGEGSLGDLTASYKKLEDAGKALISQQALIDRFKGVSEAVEKARDKAVAAANAFNQFRFALSQGGDATAKQEKQLQTLAKSSESAGKALQRQEATLAALDAELVRAGVDTAKLAQSQEQLVASANRVADAQKRASHGIETTRTTPKAVPVAPPGENPFEASGRTTLSLMQRIRGEVLALTAAYVGLQGAIQGVSSVLDAVKSEQQVQSKLLVLTGGDARAAGQEYQYLREQAERLGIFFPDLANSYTSFAIAARKANLSTQDTRFIFERVAEAGRTLHLSADDMKGVFKAIEQMVSKGQVMSEELKGQLGERLPGALQLAAAGFKKSVPEFIAELEKGNVKAREGLLALARSMDDTFSKGFQQSTKGVDAVQARFETALFDMKLAVANSGLLDAFTQLVAKFTEFLKSEDAKTLAKSLAEGFQAIASAIGFVIDNFQTLKTVAETFVGLFLAQKIAAITVEIGIFAKNMWVAAVAIQAGTKSVSGLQKAFLLLSSFFVGWEIGTVLTEKFEIVRQLGISLVIGFEKIWTRIKFGAEIVWESITSSWQDAGAFLLNAMTGTVREILQLFQKAATAVGAQGLADSIGKALDAVTAKQTTKTQARVKALTAEMQAELKKIDAIGEQMFNDASDAARAAQSKAAAAKAALPPAERTQETAPGSELKLGGGDKDAAKALEKYKSLLAEVQAVEAQAFKKQKDDIESIIAGIDKQYEALFAKIKDSGLKQAGALGDALRAAVDSLKTAAREAFEKQQMDSVASIQKTFAEAQTKLGKAPTATLDERQQAIADNYAGTYAKIAELDAAHQGNLKTQLDLLVSQLQTLEAQKYGVEQVAAAQKTVNDVIAERDARIKIVTDQITAGLIGELDGRQKIKDILDQTQPSLDKAVQSARDILEAQKEQLTPEAYEKIAAGLDLAAVSANKFKTALLDTKMIQAEMASTLTQMFDAFGQNIGEAIAGAKSWGEAFRDAGKAFLQYAAQFLRKIAEMILQQIILNALKSSFGGAAGAAAPAAVAHEGGVVGSTNRSRNVSPSWFSGAPKYHEGGIAGLAPNEYPAILKKNEEVLTTSDPRNIMNGGAGGSGGTQVAPVVQDVKVINAIDSGSFVSQGIDTPEGTKAVFNFMRANRSNIKSILGT